MDLLDTHEQVRATVPGEDLTEEWEEFRLVLDKWAGSIAVSNTTVNGKRIIVETFNPSHND